MDVAPLLSTPFEDTTLLRFARLSRMPGLTQVVTTKPWNMAPHRDADRESCIARRRRLCEHLGVSFDRLTAPDQIHSNHVLRVTARDIGAGRMGRESAVKFVDGLVCDTPDTAILQLSGDCPMILVFDPRRRALGTAHASWRGTVAAVTSKLVERMVAEFGSIPRDLHAGLAPCAGADRYEVGDDVRRIGMAMLPDASRFFSVCGDKFVFDLKAANADQLVRAGIPAENIEIAAECTLTDERFYSHRREGPSAGRFALIAAIT